MDAVITTSSLCNAIGSSVVDAPRGSDYFAGNRRATSAVLASRTMTTTAPPVGALLRGWRQRRRVSQLVLASEADVSARHLSFVETGRAKPSREFVLHMAEHLDVPLRERNALLLAAGYAPMYQETPLEAEDMAPVREALDKILSGHEPYPALVLNRRFEIVSANRPTMSILADGVAPELLEPPANAYRASLHPDGLAPRIVNLAEWSAHLIDRVRRAWVATGDADLESLLEELSGYPGVSTDTRLDAPPGERLFDPLVLRADDAELSFFSTLATFGTAVDITIAELAIESFFPADGATSAALQSVR
jgi:transcriptional regulator with XRE-family HTH domain